MRLNKPPVTQTWIGFTFEGSSSQRPWDIRSAKEFLSRFESALPHREAIFETRYEVQRILAHDLKIERGETQLDRARARNEEGTHWLQLARNQMVYNRTRGAAAYLGYESLREEALGKLSEYVEFFRPSRLRSAELYYIDQIEIPIPAEQSLDLKEYFNLRVEIPDVYGPTWEFSTRLSLRPPNEGDTLEVKFESQPSTSDAMAYRFRIDWRMVCSEIGVFDRDVVSKRLGQAHDCLTDYFKASVTKRTWDLFEPSEEE